MRMMDLRRVRPGFVGEVARDGGTTLLVPAKTASGSGRSVANESKGRDASESGGRRTELEVSPYPLVALRPIGHSHRPFGYHSFHLNL